MKDVSPYAPSTSYPPSTGFDDSFPLLELFTQPQRTISIGSLNIRKSRIIQRRMRERLAQNPILAKELAIISEIEFRCSVENHSWTEVLLDSASAISPNPEQDTSVHASTPDPPSNDIEFVGESFSLPRVMRPNEGHDAADTRQSTESGSVDPQLIAHRTNIPIYPPVSVGWRLLRPDISQAHDPLILAATYPLVFADYEPTQGCFSRRRLPFSTYPRTEDGKEQILVGAVKDTDGYGTYQILSVPARKFKHGTRMAAQGILDGEWEYKRICQGNPYFRPFRFRTRTFRSRSDPFRLLPISHGL
ncbi:hypothetical protein C8R43DRAFT_1119942 [Mycena crocata]|nr:hypothetical protein C8R43DRAFT_1119942 [Mycena crocata]